jgi:hypothetical protein
MVGTLKRQDQIAITGRCEALTLYLVQPAGAELYLTEFRNNASVYLPINHKTLSHLLKAGTKNTC